MDGIFVLSFLLYELEKQFPVHHELFYWTIFNYKSVLKQN